MSGVFRVLFFSFSLFVLPVMGFQDGAFYRGDNGQAISIQEIVSQIQPEDIVIIGEEHNQFQAASNQLKIMQALTRNNLLVSVGMEFIDFTKQDSLDLYRGGSISEDVFLSDISWGGYDFSNYREQILYPQSGFGSQTVGINAPRWLTTKVSRNGLESLTDQERRYLPPRFNVGNQKYFERFKEAAGHHIDNPQTLERYFLAQSIWDDTMAYQSLRFLDRHPKQVLVIIVGEFHSQYGGGLPDRLKFRGFSGKVWTISQVNMKHYKAGGLKDAVLPHPKYGQRADYIWLFKE